MEPIWSGALVRISQRDQASVVTWVKSVNPDTIYGRATLEDLTNTGDLQLTLEMNSSGVRLSSVSTMVPASLRLDLLPPPTASSAEFYFDGVGANICKSLDLRCIGQPLPAQMLTYRWVKAGFGACSLAEQPIIFKCMDNTGKLVLRQESF